MELVEKPTHGTLNWLNKRHRDDAGKCTFGGSDAGAMLNVSKFRTRGELYMNKMMPPVESEETPAMRRGNLFEPALIAEASHQLGRQIVTPDFMYRDGRWIVTMDGVDVPERPTLGVEAKTTTVYSISDSSDLPEEYLAQGYAQQLVLGCPIWFVVLDRNQRISVVELPENEKALQLLREQAEILGEAVDSKITDLSKIDAEFSAEQIAMLVKPQATAIELPLEAIDWVNSLDDARRMIKQGEEAEKQAKDALARMLLENEIGTFNGVSLVTWKEQAGRTSFDTTAFKTEHPDLYAAYQRSGKPFRTMRITKGAK